MLAVNTDLVVNQSLCDVTPLDWHVAHMNEQEEQQEQSARGRSVGSIDDEHD